MKAIQYWLDQNPESIYFRFNKSLVFKFLKLILKNNNFAFTKIFFHRIAVTAMGTIIAPTYATLVMGCLGIQFYEKCENEFGVNNGKQIEENWHWF